MQRTSSALKYKKISKSKENIGTISFFQQIADMIWQIKRILFYLNLRRIQTHDCKNVQICYLILPLLPYFLD